MFKQTEKKRKSPFCWIFSQLHSVFFFSAQAYFLFRCYFGKTKGNVRDLASLFLPLSRLSSEFGTLCPQQNKFNMSVNATWRNAWDFAESVRADISTDDSACHHNLIKRRKLRWDNGRQDERREEERGGVETRQDWRERDERKGDEKRQDERGGDKRRRDKRKRKYASGTV